MLEEVGTKKYCERSDNDKAKSKKKYEVRSMKYEVQSMKYTRQSTRCYVHVTAPEIRSTSEYVTETSDVRNKQQVTSKKNRQGQTYESTCKNARMTTRESKGKDVSKEVRKEG